MNAFHYVEGPMQPSYHFILYQRDFWVRYQVSPTLFTPPALCNQPICIV